MRCKRKTCLYLRINGYFIKYIFSNLKKKRNHLASTSLAYVFVTLALVLTLPSPFESSGAVLGSMLQLPNLLQRSVIKNYKPIRIQIAPVIQVIHEYHVNDIGIP